MANHEYRILNNDPASSSRLRRDKISKYLCVPPRRIFDLCGSSGDKSAANTARESLKPGQLSLWATGGYDWGRLGFVFIGHFEETAAWESRALH